MAKAKRPEIFNRMVLESAASIASKIGAKKIFLYADTVENLGLIKDLSKKIEIILVTRVDETYRKADEVLKNVLSVTTVNLTRIGQMKMAVMKGLSAGLINKNDRIVCLAGVPKFGRMDSIVILDIGKEFELLTSESIADIADELKQEVFETVLNLSIELANQGREGKPVGAIFVVGDHEKVIQLSRQLIINPFKGYSEEERNILAASLKETIKEFSVLDGAFVIREDGVIIAAGRYLSASLEKGDVPKGLGSRHISAAGITSVTDAVALVISESTGTVRIYKKGKMFMEIERSL